MDKSFNKFVNYINKRKTISLDELEIKFNLTPYETYEIIKTLYKNKYIIPLGDDEYQATYKSKTYKKSFFLSWFSQNIIAILALIVSIVALIRTF